MAAQTSRTVQLSEAESRDVAAALGKAVEGKRHIGRGEVQLAVVSSQGAVVRRWDAGGRKLDLRELELMLTGAEVALEQLTSDPPKTTPQLTAGEASLLDEAGLPEAKADAPGALERTRIEFELLLRESRDLEDIAKALRLTPSRLRQRLSARTLYGIKDGRSWRIPRFQFKHGKLVRGLDVVLPRIRSDTHPVAVKRWLTTPHQDLVSGGDDEKRVTPLAWLEAGNSPEEVAKLAAEL